MKRLKTIAFGLGLVLAGTAFANASPQSTLKANAMVCVTQSGIEATHTGINVKQLLSLGCTIAPTDLRVDLLPPSKPRDFFLFVAATLPDKILRYWIRRDELGDRALNFAAADVDCRYLGEHSSLGSRQDQPARWAGTLANSALLTAISHRLLGHPN